MSYCGCYGKPLNYMFSESVVIKLINKKCYSQNCYVKEFGLLAFDHTLLILLDSTGVM